MMTRKLIDPAVIGKKGGKARAAALSKEELSEQARKAVQARWAKAKARSRGSR